MKQVDREGQVFIACHSPLTLPMFVSIRSRPEHAHARARIGLRLDAHTSHEPQDYQD